MRYAVPVSDGKLASHFGHCEHFALFDVDTASGTILGRQIVPSPGHQPGFLPRWLAEHGVVTVIAGGMGQRAQTLFRENRINVVVGALGHDPEQVVLEHACGRLRTGDNICDH